MWSFGFVLERSGDEDWSFNFAQVRTYSKFLTFAS